MTEFTSLLASLQQSDSFFPSGSMAFSWGLEALQQDGLVTDVAKPRKKDDEN